MGQFIFVIFKTSQFFDPNYHPLNGLKNQNSTVIKLIFDQI